MQPCFKFCRSTAIHKFLTKCLETWKMERKLAGLLWPLSGSLRIQTHQSDTDHVVIRVLSTYPHCMSYISGVTARCPPLAVMHFRYSLQLLWSDLRVCCSPAISAGCVFYRESKSQFFICYDHFQDQDQKMGRIERSRKNGSIDTIRFKYWDGIPLAPR